MQQCAGSVAKNRLGGQHNRYFSYGNGKFCDTIVDLHDVIMHILYSRRCDIYVSDIYIYSIPYVG